ncbi:MAG: hypothetical protein QOE80_3935 [Actinomycetota bacterium]|jgi:hypothetical protein|nr:hypothetical protein [Actinomycetota bacterium]
MANRNRPGPAFERRGVVVPFLVHQLLDYLAGLYLLQVGSHLRGRPATVSYGAGAVFLLAAMFSGKPLGGGRLSRRAHRLVDMALIAGVAAAPFVFGLAGTASNVVRFEGLAVLLILVVKYTSYVRVPPGTTTRALKEQGPRLAGQILGRRMSKRRPPGT